MADSNPTPAPKESITETEVVQPQSRRRGILVVVVVVVVVVVPVVVVNVVVVVPVDGNVVDVVVVANALIGASKMTTSTAARRTTSRCETLVRLCDTNPPPIGEVATNIDLRGLRIPADIDVGTARLPFASVIVRRRLTS